MTEKTGAKENKGLWESKDQCSVKTHWHISESQTTKSYKRFPPNGIWKGKGIPTWTLQTETQGSGFRKNVCLLLPWPAGLDFSFSLCSK